MKRKVNFLPLFCGIGIITIVLIATYYYSFGHNPLRDNLFAYTLIMFSLFSGYCVTKAEERDASEYCYFEDVEDGTAFKILHMASVTESTSTFISMGISTGENGSCVYLLKTTGDKFNGGVPEAGKEYTKTKDGFYELK